MGDQFSCFEDEVYAFLKFQNRKVGDHLLEGKWYGPDGKIQQYTQVPLTIDPPGVEDVFIWLKFHVEKPGPSDLLFPNYENEVFNGDWTVNVHWDKEKVASSTFSVRCL